VGIAENQWDFNDHAAMAGFGPLDATSFLVAQALGILNPSGQGTSETSALEQAVLQSGQQLPCIEPVEDLRQVAETTDVEASPGLPAPRCHGGAVDASPGPPPPRSHGGALPK
jgi:hypothetical protein